MSLQTVISDLATRIGTEFKAIRVLISGTGTGGVGGLTTTATDLVGAVNEVNAALGSAGASINDAATNTTETWSSSQIDTQITSEVAAALEGEDLSDLAAQVAANAAADIGFVSASAAQSFSTAEQLQASQNIGIGNPETNFVAIFEAALT